MFIDRRTWLRSAMALAVATQMPARARSLSRPALLTAWVADDQAMAGLWHTDGRLQGVELPNRAHEVLAMPGALGQQGMALAVGRRPGEYLLRFDARRAKTLQWHDMEMDRLLCGHAAFSPDGQTLYTPEFDAASGDGLIVERDAMTLRKRREYASGGLGPHAMLVEPNGNLLVTNGGLLILPETGRRKLNREHMTSNVARLDGKTGRVLDTWTVADPFLSLRHIARTPDGRIAIASQAEHLDDAARNAAPILSLLDTHGLTSVALPAGLKLGGYAGDIAYVPDASGPSGRYVLSATRAGQLAWWSTEGQWLGQQALPKASAIAVVDAAQWLASGDKGAIHGSLAAAPLDAHASGLRWDNHAVLVGV
ncbi:DUF1513 domain-containing protein [Variovorax sp. HJSM1_2]|uniref:DUF1513 domain-containing protein n=1 Tax=Variovorax sp. HJSM1_2 TaxID=3366263 RepID=UPI003BCB464A